jgi:hypothetical protein
VQPVLDGSVGARALASGIGALTLEAVLQILPRTLRHRG